MGVSSPEKMEEDASEVLMLCDGPAEDTQEQALVPVAGPVAAPPQEPSAPSRPRVAGSRTGPAPKLKARRKRR